MSGKREITAIEAGMAETIARLERDKAELVGWLKDLDERFNHCARFSISADEAYDAYYQEETADKIQKHGGNNDHHDIRPRPTP